MAERPDRGGLTFRLPAAELSVAALLVIEIAVFAMLEGRFFSAANVLEIVRSGCELGLLSLAMTLVIKSGGIDLSVGSVMGVAGVILGMLTRAGIPVGVAAMAAILAGTACGFGNGLLVTVLRVPALVATLGSMALWRGLAEGLTGGYEVYTEWPRWFLALGQGYLGGAVPPQLPLLALAAALSWVVLHHTPFGRRIEAIGYSPEGALFGGVSVMRCMIAVYTLSGLAAGLAGVLSAAHVGQAKADTGTGYELAAVTAVVLGGSSIHGGRGGIPGTVIGLATIACLQNGTLLSGLPSEAASVFLGTILLLSAGLSRLGGVTAPARHIAPGGFRMKNAQVAVLVAAMLLAAGIVALSNWMLVKSLAGKDPDPGNEATRPSGAGKRWHIAVMPKSKSDPYFVSCKKGADEASRELGLEILWDGPTETDAARQNDVVEAWITRGVDVIAASVENKEALSSVLRKARGRGIKVLTWDADAEQDARDFLVNQATAEGIGSALADEAGRILQGSGRFAIITATLTAANQNEWIRHIRARVADRWPKLEIAVIRPSDGQRDKALTETSNVLRAYPEVKLIMAIAAPAVPGAAEAVKQAQSAVKVIGLSVPSLCRSYVHEGIIESIILWNTLDLGYLTVHAAVQLAEGRLRAGTSFITAGRLGSIEVAGDEILLGRPFRFDRSNIDRFEF